MARTEDEIMKDILGVYCRLSPENLTCDGEASRSWVRQHERELNAQLRTLEKELGRNMDESEAIRWDMKRRPLRR